MQKIDGWLRAHRRPSKPYTRSGNPLIQLASLIERSRGPQKVAFWYLESYGYQYRFASLPAGISEGLEDEWVSFWAQIKPWKNGFGANCRCTQVNKPKEKKTMNYGKCAACNKLPPDDDSWNGLCLDCRRMIELGRAVEEMPEGHSLERKSRWFLIKDPLERYVVVSDGKTPLEALRGAKGEV